MKNIYTKSGKKIQKAVISDGNGEIEIIWYNQPFLVNLIRPGGMIAVAGETKWFGSKLVFENPSYELVKNPNRLIHTGRLVSVYPETEGISSKWIRSRIDSLFSKFNFSYDELLPPDIITRYHLLDRKTALYHAHFPQNFDQANSARKRLAFDELFILNLAANMRKKSWLENKAAHSLDKKIPPRHMENFIRKLPFQLTNAQTKATSEILSDLTKEKPMNRLLEGDVGSGKTIVATIAMYFTWLNGYKSILMAPTEILARQHFHTISTLLEPYSIKTGLFTGAEKEENTKQIDIFVGTHALLYQKIPKRKIALIVIDEQQRFGVKQRTMLREKGKNPHTLTMTATPIPRTVALTLYADLDLSVIDEMPVGRQRVKTWVVPAYKRERAYQWIRNQILDHNPHHQAFIVCPLIDPSDNLESVKAVKEEYRYLSEDVFTDLKVGILHGKVKVAQKEKTLENFRNGNIDILVSTPVVEVGIDIPNATIMLIEGAERFGLSQLHQLRGRVGRNDAKSYCLIFSEKDDELTISRLKLLEKYHSGPKLAEMDMKIRGPGDIYGTKQHGLANLKIADLSDLQLIEQAKEAVDYLLVNHPNLQEYPLIREKMNQFASVEVAPD